MAIGLSKVPKLNGLYLNILSKFVYLRSVFKQQIKMLLHECYNGATNAMGWELCLWVVHPTRRVMQLLKISNL